MIPSYRKFKPIFLFFLVTVLFSACKGDKKVDVSDIAINVKIERFDRDLDAMRTKPMAQQAAYMQNKYGVFYTDYIQQMLEAGSVADTTYFAVMRQIFAGRAYQDLKHDVDSVYPGSMEKQEAELTDAFRRIKYYYPQRKTPKVYAYFSGFKAQTVIGEDYVGIGLDLFLGANSRFYPALTETFPRYLSRRFNAENITPRIVEGIAREELFPENDNQTTLLDKMIHNGKILYFMDKVLPDANDTLKIGYTARQLKFVQDNQAAMWAWFLEQNSLYETDYQKIQTYLNEAPFTPGIGTQDDSAPKLGSWTGWQIVRLYMEKHPDITLQQLMANNNAQKILNESKYRPK